MIRLRDMQAIFARPVPKEDLRPFWKRLLTSLRPHADLKKKEFTIRGGAKF